MIQQLRQILGDHVPSEKLAELLDAYDFDLNRAVNGYFSGQATQQANGQGTSGSVMIIGELRPVDAA